MSPLALLVSLAVAAPVEATTLDIAAPIHDALFVGKRGEIWLLAGPGREGEPRRAFVLDASGKLRRGPALPANAVATDACPVSGGGEDVVYADARGIVDARGQRLLEGDALFAVPDPAALFVTDLCGGPGRRELRLAVRGGVVVRGEDGVATELTYPAAARAYSGRVHRGLRPERPYGMALSLYAPRLYDADVDGDGRLDLLALHEGRLAVYRRDEGGRLEPRPARVLALQAKLGASADADLRVVAGDLDKDGRVELVVGVTEGPAPERSEAWLLSSEKGIFDRAPERLWSRAGLLAPLAITAPGGAPSLLVSEVDTSLVALGAVLMTGQVGVKLWRIESGRGPFLPALELSAHVDVRQGRMAGALPVTSVDFDRDGRRDLLDVGTPALAALYRGSDDGFAKAPEASLAVPPFVHVVPLPRLPGAVLVGAPDERGHTKVALIVGPPPRRK